MTIDDNIFSGLKVLDVASFIAGPAAATILSDFGADVIKIEPPGFGDPYRAVTRIPPYPPAKASYTWQLNNRNKRSLALNLKSPAAKEILAKLVAETDVLVTNFPPHVKTSLGLAYDTVSAINPRLIYADLTGYGEKGPDADKPGFDMTAYWGATGLMDVTHDAGSPPTLPIPGIGDHATASTLFSAIVTGLYRRERTGLGSHVTTSLLAEGIWAASDWIEAALNGAKFYPQHDRKVPPNALLNPYCTSDNRWILLLSAQEKDWPGFVQAIGQPQLLEDPRFAETRQRAANAPQLVEVLDALFATQPLNYWRDTLDKGRVIFGVVRTLEETAHDPQALANDIIVPLAEPTAAATHTVNSPMQVVGVQKAQPRRAPDVGEHTRAILSGLGFSEADIHNLEADGVVSAAPPSI